MKNFVFFMQFHQIFNFSRQISEKFRFFRAMSQKIRLSRQNWPFTATSEKIILFLFKSNHFRTYFLYMIRYNHNPSTTPCGHPPAQNLGVATPSPTGLTLLVTTVHKRDKGLDQYCGLAA